MSHILEKGTVYLIVIDGLGAGAQEDASAYGDENANTLGNVCEVTGCKLPNFGKLGIGNIIPLKSVPENPDAAASWGKMREYSAGKDSTTGHWELAGIQLDKPFPTYPDGFPENLIRRFCKGIGKKEVLCNKPYSGIKVIDDFGEKHIATGAPIVYTSADSVLQVACHEEITPVDQLYEWCRFAREKVMTGKHGVGRVIARPFIGKPGEFRRLNEKRHDYSLKPFEPNLLGFLKDNTIRTYSIGKVVDLFSEDLFTQFRRTKSNAEGISQLLSLMSAQMNGFVFVNLIDTDQIYGHRQDPGGYAGCLQEIDRALPAITGKLRDTDMLIITGDHGNDPADESTDHTREFVPLLVINPGNNNNTDLGIRNTFSDVAASVADYFRLENLFPGNSFYAEKV
jgi:phosphopentomutase